MNRLPQPYPFLRASSGRFYWTLPAALSFDAFSLREVAPASLLLIGMHLAETRPWECARRPLFLEGEPQLIDRESKRLLGKRLRQGEDPGFEAALPLEPLDSIALVLGRLEAAGHSFQAEASWPSLSEKQPGHLLPRRLLARARVIARGEEFTFSSRNFSEISQCLHAELLVLLALSRALSDAERSPGDLELFELQTTLKPCKMCAAFLFMVGRRSRSFLVQFETDDPGPLARDTLLDRYGYHCR